MRVTAYCSSMYDSPGPQAGTWSAGRFCSQTWRPGNAGAGCREQAAEHGVNNWHRSCPAHGGRREQEHQPQRHERDALEHAQRTGVEAVNMLQVEAVAEQRRAQMMAPPR